MSREPASAVASKESASALASKEVREVLAAYEAVQAEGGTPTVALLDSAVMRRLGRNIVMIECEKGRPVRFLYAGVEVPDDVGRPIGGRTLADIAQESAAFYTRGTQAVLGRDEPQVLTHRGGHGASVHRWEALFLPLAERPGGPRCLVAAICAPLEHKHAFFRALLDTMPQAALVVEPAGGSPLAVAPVISANAGAARLLGRESIEAVISRPLADAFAHPDIEANWLRLLAEMQSGMSARFEYNHRCEHSARWFDVQVSPLSQGMLFTLTDITDLKRAILDLEHQRKALLEEMEQRRTLEEELWALAHLDPLTGLPNRRAFREQAQTTMVTAQTLNRPCAMISIDIDHFKRINDGFGHGAGDVVLRRVADILKAPLRPEVDIAARLGGEEFTVLLPDTELSGARAFAEMLRHRVEHTVVIVGEAEIRPAISLGVAMVQHDGDLDNLIDRSDRMLYAAKRTGRNRVVCEGDNVEPLPDQVAA